MSPAPALSLAFSKGAPAAAPQPTPALAIRGLTASYGETPAVFSVDAAFPPAALSAIIGPNGAGKSTLLKAALGVTPRVSGEVEVFGAPLERARDRVAYVPQRAAVDWDFPASVMDVVRMGLHRRVGLLGRMTGALQAHARACLDRVGLADFADRQIGQLSGGQQQRVFLARALAQDADLHLLDEPFAGVDAATERAIVDVLRDLRAAGKAVVCVHHDLSTVAATFDHVLLLNVRPVAEGPTAQVFTADALARAYGGRLAAAHVAEVAVAGASA